MSMNEQAYSVDINPQDGQFHVIVYHYTDLIAVRKASDVMDAMRVATNVIAHHTNGLPVKQIA